MAAPMGNNNPQIKMDPAYFEEQEQQPQQSSFQPEQQQVNRLKRTLTLDLNRAPAFKKSKLVNQPPVLSSPDLHMLKLASPELERIIMQNQNGSLTTPTPSMLFPRSVTEEQELYARGFVEALNELHHSDSSSQMDGPQAPDTPVTYTTLEPQQPQQQNQQNNQPSPPNNIIPGLSGFVASSCSGGSTSSGASSPVGSHYAASMSPGLQGVRIKEEPQTVPSMGGGSPPMSPINMESQERIKLERKRQRNRLAASKCRRRKLERISRLEDKVKSLKGENSELSTVLNRLKEHVCQLKEQVMEHVNSGCQIMTGTSTLAF